MRAGTATPAAELVTVRDASARTGIPRRRLYKWIETEKMWSIRIGDRILLHTDDVETLALRKAS